MCLCLCVCVLDITHSITQSLTGDDNNKKHKRIKKKKCVRTDTCHTIIDSHPNTGDVMGTTTKVFPNPVLLS